MQIITMLKKTSLTLAFTIMLIWQAAGPARAQQQIADQIIAVVGKSKIMVSDIEMQYLQMRMQGSVTGSASKVKCQIIENMLYEKLLLHQAVLDSIEVTDSQVEQQMDQRLRYFINQFGSQEKLEDFYQKSIIEIKNEFRDEIRKQLLIKTVQDGLTENVQATPAQVKSFYKAIPLDSIPLINAEIEIAEIVRMPPISMSQKIIVKERLRELRRRIVEGETFTTLAVLYSEDPGTASKGGELGFYGRGELYPEFEAVAFKLNQGEVSDIVETEAGFHIIQMIERQGEYINVRHILLQTKVSPVDLNRAREELDSIAIVIRNGDITFEDAVKLHSNDPDKQGGGMLVNLMTGTTKFEMDQLDPQISFTIDKLKVGELSNAVPMKTEDNKDAYRLILLKTRTLPHRANLEEDYDKIYNWTLNQLRTEEVQNWVNKNVKNVYVRINERYKYCNFEFNWWQAKH